MRKGYYLHKTTNQYSVFVADPSHRLSDRVLSLCEATIDKATDILGSREHVVMHLVGSRSMTEEGAIYAASFNEHLNTFEIAAMEDPNSDESFEEWKRELQLTILSYCWMADITSEARINDRPIKGNLQAMAEEWAESVLDGQYP